MALNAWLAVAGVSLLGLGVFHSVLGEIYLVRRLLRRDNLPKLFGGDSFTKLTIRYAWHLLTVLCFAVAVLFLLYAVQPADPAVRVVLRLFAAFVGVGGVWGLVATRGRHLSWIVLLGIAAAGWIGAS